ncbi:hypothetical protein LCGC14_1576220 [marine sediment metagenome]|uniref:Lipoprotein n=1 Tax=marine sediment metagenome TaxID=412755 RepID=A0A0F9KZ65_9ZZZZ
MKKFLVLLMCFATLIPLVSGCSIFNSNQTVTQVELQENIEFFVKTAIRITLHETKPSVDDLKNLQAYLVTAQELVVSGLQDLEALRELVKQMLPDQYHVLAFTIVDVIERYVLSHLPDPDENVVRRNQLIGAGLGGAVDAIDEYVSLKSK